MDSTSNTLKSLTNPHTIRGIATIKDVERFSKRHLERYREFIVKLIVKFIVLPIVNYLSNKLPILSKANSILTYTGSEATKNLSKECEQSSTKEKPTIGSILFSGEDKRLCVYSLPCDYYQSEDDLPKIINSSIILMLSTLLLLLFFIPGNIFCFTLLMLLILTLLGFNTVQFLDYYTQTIVTSSFNDCGILDKTICLTVYGVYNDAEVTIKISNTIRSPALYVLLDIETKGI